MKKGCDPTSRKRKVRGHRHGLVVGRRKKCQHKNPRGVMGSSGHNLWIAMPGECKALDTAAQSQPRLPAAPG